MIICYNTPFSSFLFYNPTIQNMHSELQTASLNKPQIAVQYMKPVFDMLSVRPESNQEG